MNNDRCKYQRLYNVERKDNVALSRGDVGIAMWGGCGLRPRDQNRLEQGRFIGPREYISTCKCGDDRITLLSLQVVGHDIFHV